jgi:hypothetical protein
MPATTFRTALVVAACLVAIPAAANTIPIAALGLKVEAPAGTTIETDPDHEHSVAVEEKDFSFRVGAAGDADPKTVEDALARSVLKPKNVKVDKLADGWIATYDLDLGDKVRYLFTAYRTIGGRGVVCDGGDDVAARLALAVAGCKSLHR